MDIISKIVKSRTVIFNVLVVVTAVMTLLLNHQAIAAYPEATAVLVSIAGAVNIALRFLTATSLFGKLDEIEIPKGPKK